MKKLTKNFLRFMQKNKVASIATIAIVAIIGAVGILVVNATSSTIKVTGGSGTGYYHASYTGGSYHKYGDIQYYTTSDGSDVLCIEPGTELSGSYETVSVKDEEWLTLYNSTSAYTITQDQLDLIKAYAYFGYGNTGTTNAYKAATQMLIWRVIDENQVFTSINCVNNTEEEVDPLTGEVITQAQTCEAISDPTAATAAMAVIQEAVDGYFVYLSIDDEKQDVTIGESATFTDTTGTLSDYTVESCTNCTAEISGDTLTVTPTNVGTYEVTLQLTYDNYDDSMGMIATSDGQNMLVVGNLDPKTATVSGEVTGAKIQVVKYDSDNNSCTAQGDATLGGAQYGVYDSNNDLVATLTIGSNCTSGTTTELGLGTYTIKELVAPEGYQLSSETKQVTITSANSGETIQVQFTNDIITYEFELIKTMSDGTTGLVETEANAEFEIYLKSTGELVTTITTDANGKAAVVLPYGIYTVKQTVGTANYFLADEFEVNLKSEDQSVVINNSELTAKLKLVKVDADTGNVITLSNIKFKIWSVEDNDWVSFKITYPSTQTIDVFETDETGSFTTPSVLGSGTYIIYEVEDQTIDGYLWNDEGVEFEITFDTELDEDEDGNNIVLIYFGNTAVKGSVELTKTGETLVCENGECAYTFELLEGVTFGIYAREDITDGTGNVIYAADDLVTEIATDADGVASIGGLYLGKYYFKEISTIENYILDETEYDFELTYEDQYTSEVTYATTIKNYYDKTTVKFYKKDLSDETLLLAGAEICVYTVDGDLVECMTTDADGFAAIGLPIGEYYYTEVVAPEGYQLDPETYYFSITDSGQTLVVDVLNEFLIVNAPNTNVSNWEIVVILAAFVGGVLLLTVVKKSKDEEVEDTSSNDIESNEDDSEIQNDESDIVEETIDGEVNEDTSEPSEEAESSEE